MNNRELHDLAIRTRGGVEEMNELNYASLEAGKRLVEAGIVLETEAVWMHVKGGSWYLRPNDNTPIPVEIDDMIPAPSMAEVWRELLDVTITKDSKNLGDGISMVWQCPGDNPSVNTNPTDALIDLLIWVKQEAAHDFPVRRRQVISNCKVSSKKEANQ